MVEPSIEGRPALVDRLRAAGCVYAEAEADLLIEASAGSDELASLVSRRVAGEPLEHILGWAEFCGLRVALDSAVFVPRRRTELLVREARARLQPGAIVVDLCCGSGAVGLVIATGVAAVSVYAVDVDPVAVRCAARNLAAVGGRALVGDLYAPLPAELRGTVDTLVANAPYVPTAELPLMPTEARDHEPATALDGGPDGVAIHRRIAADARRWLAPDGCLLIETSEVQAGTTAAAIQESGLVPRVVHSEELDATVVVATTPSVSS